MQAGVIGLQHYLYILYRKLWLILLSVIVCGGATFGICKTMSPVYQASGLLQVTGTTGGGGAYNNQLLAQNYSVVMTSSVVLQSVSDKLNHISVSQLQSNLTAAPQVNTAIINAQAKANDPKLSADIVNKTFEAFREFQITKQTAQQQNTVDELAQSLDVAKANLAAAQGQLGALQKANATAAAIQQQQNIVNNDQGAYDTLQTNYQTNYNLLQQQKTQISNTLTIIQPAVAPVAPLAPKTVLNTALAAALSFLLTVVFIFVLDWIDTSIKTPDDVVNLARLHPLGSIPVSQHPLLFKASVDEQVLRGFVAIGATFDVLTQRKLDEDKVRIIQVAGLRSGVGTSTMSANLAISLANSGRRVLLIDADLRQPALRALFSLPNGATLAKSLHDAYTFQQQHPDYISSWLDQWRTPIPNFWLLPADPAPPSDVSIFRMSQLSLLLQALLQSDLSGATHVMGMKIDLVIFDTPPLDGAADATALSAITDATVLVVEAGKDRADAVWKAQQTLLQLRSPILGVIINKKKAGQHSYFYVDPLSQNPVSVEKVLPESADASAPPVQNSSVNQPPEAMNGIPLGNVPTGPQVAGPPNKTASHLLLTSPQQFLPHGQTQRSGEYSAQAFPKSSPDQTGLANSLYPQRRDVSQ